MIDLIQEYNRLHRRKFDYRGRGKRIAVSLMREDSYSQEICVPYRDEEEHQKLLEAILYEIFRLNTEAKCNYTAFRRERGMVVDVGGNPYQKIVLKEKDLITTRLIEAIKKEKDPDMVEINFEFPLIFRNLNRQEQSFSLQIYADRNGKHQKFDGCPDRAKILRFVPIKAQEGAYDRLD